MISLLLDLSYSSSQFYLLICFLLKLLFPSFLSTITVTQELDSKNKDSNNIRHLWLLLQLRAGTGKYKLRARATKYNLWQDPSLGSETGKHKHSIFNLIKHLNICHFFVTGAQFNINWLLFEGDELWLVHLNSIIRCLHVQSKV